MIMLKTTSKNGNVKVDLNHFLSSTTFNDMGTIAYPEPEKPDSNVPDTRHRAENQVQHQDSEHDVV